MRLVAAIALSARRLTGDQKSVIVAYAKKQIASVNRFCIIRCKLSFMKLLLIGFKINKSVAEIKIIGAARRAKGRIIGSKIARRQNIKFGFCNFNLR